MTLALHGKSRQRQLFLILLALLTVGAAVFGGTIAQQADKAFAANTGILVPQSQGNYDSWDTFGSGSGETGRVNEGQCAGSDSNGISESSNNDRSSFDIDLSSIPNDSTISNITIYACAERTSGSSNTADYELFYRTGGDNFDSSDIGASQSGRTTDSRSFNVNITKSGGTDIEIGAQKADNTGTIGIYALWATIEYTEATSPADDIPLPNNNPGGFDQCVAPNIMLVIDNSTSIGGALGGMKTGINQMITDVTAALPGTNWAGVHFRRSLSSSTISTPSQGWTTTIGTIQGFVDGAQSDGYTPTANGIAAAQAVGFAGNGRPHLMIIITDGDPNVELNDGNSAGTSESAYVNGGIDAVTQANNARSSGWNTALATFGGGDTNAQSALGGNYAAYNTAVQNGLAGIPNGGPTGLQVSATDPQALTAAVTDALLANCQGAVIIEKYLDGALTDGYDFTASATNGTVPGGTLTTANGGTVSFNVDLANQSDVATVTVTESPLPAGISFATAECRDEQQNVVGSLSGQAVNSIPVDNTATITCKFYNTTDPTTGSVTIQKMVPDGQGGWVEHAGDDIWGFYYLLQGDGTPITIADGATVDLAPGDYTFIEPIPTGWQGNGTSLFNKAVVATCSPDGPANAANPPVSSFGAAARNVNNLEAGEEYLVCFYNQEVATLTVKKMVRDGDTWVPDNGDWGFKYQLMSDSVSYVTATSVATNAVTTLPIDTYRVFENIPASWTLVGFSNYVSDNATCGAEGPASILGVDGEQPHAVANIDLTTGDKTVCFYNERNLDPVTVEKSGTGSYDVDWSVTKTVTPDVLNLPENGEGDTVYTVQVNKTISGVEAGGTITITNPNAVDIEVTVSDPGAILGGDCSDGSATVPANGNIQCSWDEAIGGNSIPTGYTNTVTVSGPWDGDPVTDTTDTIVFTIDAGSDTTTVSDDFAGNVTGGVAKPNGEVINTSSIFQYTATHTCEGITNWSQVDGSGSKTVENTATITDSVGNNNEDDADVDIDCQLRKVTLVKDVEGGNAQPGEWLLTATGNGGDPEWTFFDNGTAVGYVPTEWSFFLSESTVDGYSLDRILCAVGSGAENDFTNGGPVNLAGHNNDDVLCTFVNIADQALAIEKIAQGTYDDVWTWTIDKTGDITVFEGDAGEGFDVEYTTTSSPTITGRENGTVIGDVNITNSNNFDVDVTIADSLGEFAFLECYAYPGTVSLPNEESGFTVPANGYVECGYSVIDVNAANVTTNTVTVTSTSHDDLGGTADATIDWSPNGNAADPAYLHDNDNYDEDPNNPFTANYTEETTEQEENYERAFECPAWPSDVYYDNGVFTGEYTFDILNTAVLYKNDNLEGDEWDRDDHTVEVTCTVDRGSIDVQKTVDWNNVPEANQPDTSFDICIAGPFEDLTAASTFLTSMPSTPFAPNSAPSGDWFECDTVADGEFAEFDELEPGAYAVAEKDPGAAFFQTLGPWAVNVEPGDEHRMAGDDGIINQYQRGDLRIVKTVNWGDANEEAASFDICITGPAPSTTEVCGTVNTNGTGNYNVDFLDLVPGDYTVSETDPGDTWNVNISPADITVAAGQTTEVTGSTVSNTRLYGDLQVSKSFSANGGTFLPGTQVTICVYDEVDVLVPFSDESDCVLFTAPDGGTETYENLEPGDYTVEESTNGVAYSSSTVSVNGADPVVGTEATITVTDDATEIVAFSNTLATANLTICKEFVGDESDEGVLPGITITPDQGELPGWEEYCFTIEVGANTPLTVTEVLPDGYFPAQEPTLSGVCTIQQQEELVAELIIAQTLSFLGLELVEAWLEADLSGIPAGESCTVIFTNEPVGELVIVKEDNVNSEEPVTWTFDVDNGEVPDAAVIIGSGSDSNTVATGTYNVREREVDGLNRVDICEVDSPAGSYQVRVQVNGGDVLLDTNATVDVNRGETTTVTFYNDDCGRILGGANLFVNKFEASAEGAFSGSNGLEDWTMELTCIAGECESGGFPGALDTDAAGLASFGAVPTGRYEVCEVPQTGYDVVGSLLDGSDSQAGECREVIVTEEAAGPDGNVVVDFYNYPLGGLRVEKRQLDGGALDVSDNGGWEITVEGCGESFTQTTNEAIPNSWTVFENLPACDDYVVSENVNSKPGYTPVGPASYEFAFNPGDDLVFTFVNDTVPENTPTNTPETGETPTPTNTPETPTNTPEPTETPVDPTEEPTSTPTPIDEVEGEITPGPTEDAGSAATPIPPASGTGNSLLGAGTGSSMFMVLLALLMTSTGLAALAMARGRATGGSRR